MLSLAKIISDMLKLGTETFAEPVEIEFAVNTEHSGRPDFSILQIRPISSTDRFENIYVTKEEEESALILSKKVMGNGRVNNVQDIVIFKDETFKRSNMASMASELELINSFSEDQYILIALGRLGSSDSWLGIPCSWSQISKAHVIVETGTKDFQAQPSEGTHFFQNVTSLGCLYLTVNPFIGEGKIDYEKIYNLPRIMETEHFIRVRNSAPFIIKADGREGKAVILINKENKDDRTSTTCRKS